MAAKGRTRAEHLGPERRRPHVLDVALRLFREHGFSGTSMEMVAKGAKVTRPVVYACFPNKRALFRALLDREERRLLKEILNRLPDSADSADPESTLMDGFTGVLTAASLAPDSWGIMFLSEHGSGEIAARVESARREVRERLAELAVPVLRGRGIKDRDGHLSKLTAHLLMGNAEAGVRLMLSEPEEWTPEELGGWLGRMTAPALDVLGEIATERSDAVADAD